MTKKRCAWCTGSFDAYITYHDQEWGVPVHEDQKHFEFLVLEGAQAGLSWATILKRREGYRLAFANFCVSKIASFCENKIQELLLEERIIRNQLKIRSVVNNAIRFIEIQKEFQSFDKYIWSFVHHKPIVHHWKNQTDVRSTSPESDALSKDLKKRGFKFVGSTIMYAHMQACGLVNDHTTGCFRYKERDSYSIPN